MAPVDQSLAADTGADTASLEGVSGKEQRPPGPGRPSGAHGRGTCGLADASRAREAREGRPWFADLYLKHAERYLEAKLMHLRDSGKIQTAKKENQLGPNALVPPHVLHVYADRCKWFLKERQLIAS